MLCYRYVPLVVSFILTIPNSYYQLTSNTIPEQINGGSPLVLGIANSNDVTIVCEIIFNNTNPLITAWRLITVDATTVLSFDLNGAANNEATQPFAVTGEVLSGSQTTQANLTIIYFTSSLDMSVLECFVSLTTLGNFTLQLIGITTIIIIIIIICCTLNCYCF